MSKHVLIASFIAVGSLLGGPAALAADDHVWTEGSVVNVTRIRTETGHFDDYMTYLSTTWRAEQEAYKKAGLIVSYEILGVEPRGPEDADLLLIVRFKNWGALDGLQAKTDVIDKAIEGSLAASNKGGVDRGKIRRVLGSSTMQELRLK